MNMALKPLTTKTNQYSYTRIINCLTIFYFSVTLSLLIIAHQGYCHQEEDQSSSNAGEQNIGEHHHHEERQQEPTTGGLSASETHSDNKTESVIDSESDTTTITLLPLLPTTSAAADNDSSTIDPPDQCLDDNYCLNGGTCLMSGGKKICICPKGFYGDHCETRNICQTIIVESLTGDQICSKIGRECFKNDRFFRCSCLDDEYFVFRTSPPQQQAQRQPTPPKRSSSNIRMPRNYVPTLWGNESQSSIESQKSLPSYGSSYNTMASATVPASDHPSSSGGNQQTQEPSIDYLAECRKIDKCLGIRCRQRSEVCSEGECICNQDLGYSKDPRDGLCKLLDPCSMPQQDDVPICGQAQCVATYDHELYRCICPIGYKAIKVGEKRSSTQCAPITDTICNIPLLNKCQHLCQVDNTTNSYKCSCLSGYYPGTRQGVNDHLCFFDERLDDQRSDNHLDDGETIYDSSVIDPVASSPFTDTRNRQPPAAFGTAREYVYKPYPSLTKQQARVSSQQQSSREKLAEPSLLSTTDRYGFTFTYDPLTTPDPSVVATTEITETGYSHSNLNGSRIKLNDGLTMSGDDNEKDELLSSPPSKPSVITIKREIRIASGRESASSSAVTGSSGSGDSSSGGQMRSGHWPMDGIDYMSVNKMSAQDRCNIYCEENKICVLESGSTDSYRCVCDRQGYVSVGDKCLHWCAAAEFTHRISDLLAKVCWSGICRPTGPRPSNVDYVKMPDNNPLKLEHDSSWRPTFECDCSSSPLLIQDPETKLCKLDFQAILSPCMPGKEGYIDCVENKNAYCAVLHKQTTAFILDLLKERPATDSQQSTAARINNRSSTRGISGGSSSSANSKANDKFYTCVCSPEKKFLVDVPRGKATCVDECDLVNVECERFNRMCRVATIAPDDFGRQALVIMDSDGYRMNFKRTGCECLPGFNVGPSESVDFTLDDNIAFSSNTFELDSYPATSNFVNKNDQTSMGDESSEHRRAKYMNINSRCLLDYDVIEFHAGFKAPANFDPNWIKIRYSSRITWSNSTGNSNNIASGRSNQKGNQQHQQQVGIGSTNSRNGIVSTDCADGINCILRVPRFMISPISEMHKKIVLVAQCDPILARISFETYRECIKYRYWIVQKLRQHFVDWRRVMTAHLIETFNLMEGNVRLRVNKCEATLTRLISSSNSVQTKNKAQSANDQNNSDPTQTYRASEHDASSVAAQQAQVTASSHQKQAQSQNNDLLQKQQQQPQSLDDELANLAIDQQSIIDADINCVLTLHSASDDSSPRYPRKVLLEQQLKKFIFASPSLESKYGKNYYLMAPDVLIRRESFDQLNDNRKLFNPCNATDYAYCDKRTKCDMADDAVNFTCTCEYGYTPIGSRDIYYADSRKEVCEDIDECLFDICKELADNSTCINEIGDYRCQCNRNYTGDNKRYCKHVCDTIPCKHGKCRIVDDHHAFCECELGYKDTDCSVQDPKFALQKVNMIICGSIFTSCLLLAITIAISLNSQLKKAKKKLKRLEAANEAAYLFEFAHQQPFRSRMSKVSSGS